MQPGAGEPADVRHGPQIILLAAEGVSTSEIDSEELARRFLVERAAMALATDGPDGPWAASVYFAGDLDALYFVSSPHTRHGRNISSNSRVAAAINEDEHDWQAIRGIQLHGLCALADRPSVWLRGWRAYMRKFPVARELFRGRAGAEALAKLRGTRLYVLRPEHVFYLDNRLGFGERVEVPLR